MKAETEMERLTRQIRESDQAFGNAQERARLAEAAALADRLEIERAVDLLTDRALAGRRKP